MNRDEEGVEDSELAVKLSNDGLVYHVRDLPNPQAELDQLQVEEIWRQEDATRGHLLGRGGFGAVYKEKCIHDIRGSKLGRFRAVKVIERGDEVTKAYYREELKALAKFSAPRYRSWFVECFGWYEAMGKVFINMEHLEHRDLQRYLDRHFSERETNRIAFQVAKGLGFMHQNNFIHRDLKPANLLVVEKPPEKDWWVKISDFGISKRSTDGRQAYSTVNIGTQEYMAPEVRLFRPRNEGDKASYTVAADIWSLGAICVRLITESPAFDLRGLFEYYDRGEPFGPEDALASHGTSQAGRAFIQAIMARDPKLRPLAQEAIEHAWMTLDKGPLSPGVPQESIVPMAQHNDPSSPGAELAEEYRATAQWDSGVVVDQGVEDGASRPVATVPQTPSPATAEWKSENLPASHARDRGSGHLVTEQPTQATEDSAELKPPHVAKDAPPSSNSAPRRPPPPPSAALRPNNPRQSSTADPPSLYPKLDPAAYTLTPGPEREPQETGLRRFTEEDERQMRQSEEAMRRRQRRRERNAAREAAAREAATREAAAREAAARKAAAREATAMVEEAGLDGGPGLARAGKGDRVVYGHSRGSVPPMSDDEDSVSETSVYTGEARGRKRGEIRKEPKGGFRNAFKKFFVGTS